MKKPFYLLCPALLMLCLATASCDVTAENYEGEPDIYGMLTTDSSLVTIMVGKTISIMDTIEVDTVFDTIWFQDTFFAFQLPDYPWNGVTDAEVTLKRGNQSITLSEDADSSGYYRTPSAVFSPGETWELEVEYPTGEKVSTSTTLVGDFELFAPERDTLDYYDTLRWGRSQGAGGYFVTCWQWGKWDWSEEPDDYDSVRISGFMNDTSYVSVLNFLIEGFQCDSAEFEVAALDSNAYDYLYYVYNSYWRDLKLDDYMHIEGAWGVFGSQTVKKTRRYKIP